MTGPPARCVGGLFHDRPRRPGREAATRDAPCRALPKSAPRPAAAWAPPPRTSPPRMRGEAPKTRRFGLRVTSPASGPLTSLRTSRALCGAGRPTARARRGGRRRRTLTEGRDGRVGDRIAPPDARGARNSSVDARRARRRSVRGGRLTEEARFMPTQVIATGNRHLRPGRAGSRHAPQAGAPLEWAITRARACAAPESPFFGHPAVFPVTTPRRNARAGPAGPRRQSGATPSTLSRR